MRIVVKAGVFKVIAMLTGEADQVVSPVQTSICFRQATTVHRAAEVTSSHGNH